MTVASVVAADLGDEELMLRVQADDSDAFGALFDRFAARALGVAYAVARDRTRAEDIVQEAFLSIWRSRATFRPQLGSVSSWVMGIVRHRAVDSVRSNGRHDSRRADDERIEEHSQAPGSVEQAAGERDEASRLRDTLTRLPAAQREVIALAYYGELSTTEIATHLSLPLGTIKGRMRLGLEKLRFETTKRGGMRRRRQRLAEARR